MRPFAAVRDAKVRKRILDRPAREALRMIKVIIIYIRGVVNWTGM
jgi:hypothetical protein